MLLFSEYGLRGTKSGSNLFRLFMDGKTAEDFYGRPSKEVWGEYCRFAIETESEYSPWSYNAFIWNFGHIFGTETTYKRVNGKSVSIIKEALK